MAKSLSYYKDLLTPAIYGANERFIPEVSNGMLLAAQCPERAVLILTEEEARENSTEISNKVASRLAYLKSLR